MKTKHLLITIISVLMLGLCTGCGSSPTETFEAFIKAANTGDVEAASSLMSSDRRERMKKADPDELEKELAWLSDRMGTAKVVDEKIHEETKTHPTLGEVKVAEVHYRLEGSQKIYTAKLFKEKGKWVIFDVD